MLARVVLTVALLALVGCGTKSAGVTPEADSGADAGNGADAGDAGVQRASLSANCVHYQQTKIKCSTELEGRGGVPVTGRSLGDFTVTERRVDDQTGDVLETNQVTFEDSPSYQFDGAGFWEQSLTAAKTDIVFLIDTTGSMKSYLGATKTAVEGLISRLQAEHVDFRVRFVDLDDDPSAMSYTRPFRSSMEVDRMLEDLGHATTNGAEGWNAADVYDGLMLAAGNPADRSQFRPDARPIVFVVTDTIPANVYGPRWYPPSWTSATRSAVTERLARFEGEHGRPLTIRYSVPGNAGTASDPNVDFCRKHFTPGACELGYDKLGDKLGAWPPTADALHAAVDDLFSGDLADFPVLSSKYHFAWLINLDRGQIDNGQSVDITIETTVDDEPLVATAVVPGKVERGDLTVAVRGEKGEVPPEPVTFELYSVLGSRVYRVAWDKTIRTQDAGERTFELPCGKYLMWMATGRGPDYDTMRHGYVGNVDVCGKDRIQLDLDWADRDADLSVARGLVDDLAVWGPIDRPFSKFAGNADSWLDQLDDGGMTYAEYAGLKRLTLALGGYVNTTGYATVEVEAAAKDFTSASAEIRNLIRQLDDTDSSTHGALKDASTLALLAFYSTPPNVNPDATARYTSEEVAYEALGDYIKGPLLTEALTEATRLIGENVHNAQLGSLIAEFAVALVRGEWDNLDDLIARIAQVGLQAALDEAAQHVGASVGQLVQNQIDAVDDPNVTTSVKNLVKDAVTALLQHGVDALTSGSSNSVQAHLDTLAQTAKNELGGRENVVNAVDLVFAEVHDQLDYGPFRNFVWPMVHTLVRALVSKDEVDAGFVLKALATQFANRLVVYPYYADPLEKDLGDVFDAAKTWQPAVSLLDEEEAIADGSSACRADVMRPLNVDAFNVLATQSSIDDWEQWMTTGRNILKILETATAAACLYYPKMCDLASDEIPTLMSVLSGLRVMTNIFQLAIRMDMLETMSSRVDNCNALLFPSE